MSVQGASSEAPGLFTRKATGLVREARGSDALFYNVMWASVALAFAFAFLLYGAFYLGSNFVVAFLIAAVLGLPGAFLYAMLSQIMPRSGGDYVFNSRALHPSVGFAANFNYCVWLAIIYGLYTTYLVTYGFGAFGRMLAGFTGSSGWLSFGDWFSHDYAIFITGSACMIISAAVFIIGGLTLFLRLQVGAFVLYILGAFLLPLIVGIFQSKTGFIHQFNDYAANLGTTDASAKLVKSAAAAGYHPTGFNTTITLKSVSVFWYIFGFLYASNYFAGEIRMRKRTSLLSIPGALLVAVVFIGLLLPAFLHVTGYGFNGRIGLADPAAYGFASGAPAYPELMGIASGTWVIGVVIIVGFAVGLLVWLPQTMLLISRSMFAWSFDRIMPAGLSRVDARTHSPVLAILIVTVLGIASTAIYAFTTWFSTLSVLLGLSLTLLVTAVGGMVLPYRQRAMVENSPYGRRIAGLPLLTIVGALSLIGFGLAVAVLLWDPGSGASLSANPGKLWLGLGVFAVAFVIYFISSQVRRRQGIDLSLSYRELPPSSRVGLFSKRQDANGGGRLRLYYASDIHGTEVLWRKFLQASRVYEAPVVVMGGDVTGKVVIPLVEGPDGSVTAELFGHPETAATPEERAELEHRIRSNGMYPHVMTADEVTRVAGLTVAEREAWFAEVMLHTFERWMALAGDRLDDGVRCFVMPGNDDPPGVEEAIERAERVEACDERIVEFDGYTMISLGYSNRTPFDSPRELDEDELYRRVAALADAVPDHSRSIFNLHVPPYDSQLDIAPAIDAELNVQLAAGQPRMAPCGSTAVRELIERYQPVLALHGHVHESRGATHLGRTLCINPGSDYHTGRISGVLVHLRGTGADYQFVVG